MLVRGKQFSEGIEEGREKGERMKAYEREKHLHVRDRGMPVIV